MTKIKGLGRILIDFRKHPWLHFVTISTIMVSLVILGLFLLGYQNLETLAEKSSPQVMGSIYLKENLTESQIQMLREKIVAVEGVQKAVFKTKQAVLQDLQAFLGNTTIETLPGGEMFPDVMEVTLLPETSPEQIENIKSSFSRIAEIGEIDFSEDWLAQYKHFQGILKLVGMVLMGAILLACSFIISNFMGIRHQARRYELEIVRLMGATRGFLLTPFLWEGLLEGILGALLAIPVLYILKTFGAAWMSFQWASAFGIKDFSFLAPNQLLLLVGIGVTMAFLGSLTVFLRLRETSNA